MTFLRRVRRVPDHLRPRRTRVYGVGVAKCGSTSLAMMFGRHRAAHEMDAERLLPIATAVMTGELDVQSPKVRSELRRRSWRFNLEIDSAPFLNPVTPALVDVFDDARFVLLVRDCFSWLDSRVEWERSHPASLVPLFAPFRRALYQHHVDEFTVHDRALEREGLRPVTSYLRSWAERTEAVVRAVPPDRLLVVRTEDLDCSTEVLASFARVPEATVTAQHTRHNTNRTGVLTRVPSEFVVECAEELCAELMTSYWGSNWRDCADRLPSVVQP